MKDRMLKNVSYALTGLLMAGMLGSVQASSEKNNPISDDGTVFYAESVGTETTEATTESHRSMPFSGATELTPEQLYAEGVEVYDGSEGKFSQEEFERLSSLPDPGDAGNNGAEVILGWDTRERLYTTNYPATARALITFSGGRCSGNLIGANTVATAGHCVHTGGKKGSWRPKSSFRIYPGANGISKPYGYCTAKSLHSVTGWMNWRSERYDYGAIKLNCTVGNKVGWYGFTTANPSGKPAIIGGYPGDKPLQQWQSSDKVSRVSPWQIFYKNDTKGGMSGSGVWYDRDGPHIIGIHAYGTHGIGNHRNYNHGTRITKAVFNNLKYWKNLP